MNDNPGDLMSLEARRPGHIVLLSGIRTAKSLMAAALAIYAAMTCDLERLGPGEIPRVSVVSLKLDLAQVVFRHLVGHLIAKPLLKAFLFGNPTADTVTLKRLDGRLVEIKVVAGSRAGASLVARWSAGCIFDEAPRMIGSDDGVINLDDARAAVRGRLLEGAQLFEIGSPWQPSGPIFETVANHFGNPGGPTLVVKAPGPDMNPVWWTPKRVKALKAADPTAYQTDVLAQFADAPEALFPVASLEKCTRPDAEPIPWQRGHDYAAAMDPATRGNAWTLVVGTRKGDTKSVVYNRQWIGSPAEPLSPRQVLTEIKDILSLYGIDWVYTDQWAPDPLRELGHDVGLHLLDEPWTAKNKADSFLGLSSEIAQGKIELPRDRILLNDLKVTQRKVTQNGVAIHLPRTPDGRHADYAPALAKVFARWIEEDREPPPERGTPEWENWLDAQREEQEAEQLEEEQHRPWWDASPY